MLALDGLDPRVLRDVIAAGRAPNFASLARGGSFTNIATSSPPHTPVAFSNVIAGADGNVHQVFDFIHRDPAPPQADQYLKPYFCFSDVVPPVRDMAIPMGKWKLQLTGGKPRLLRRGDAFWQPLVKRGRDVSVFYIPSNYPPQGADGKAKLRAVSGMGTPDLLGSYGQFTFYTPDAPLVDQPVDGGTRVNLELYGHRGSATLKGPPNYLQNTDNPDDLIIEFEVVRDAENQVARIDIAGNVILLNAGEWSDWVPIDFDTNIPGSDALETLAAPTKLPGMVRFFLKSVHPKLELYASPINIDPLRPVNPISQPASFARTLAEQHGRYYTAGIPEDTKALQPGVLNEDEFLAQANLAHHEKVVQYEAALKSFDAGCLFFYFGASDLVSHMFWRDRDPKHPGRIASQGNRYAHVIEDHYAELDALVGEAIDKLHADDTLMVFSDHGFTTFRRAVNLNTWLLENGYLAMKTRQRSDEPGFINVDWSRTRAYALGLNGIYLNLQGREKAGVVTAGERRRLIDEIALKLSALTDADGSPVVAQIDLGEVRYPQGDPRIRPDLIVGFAEKYRISWGSVLGGIADETIVDNLERWSGTHCIADALVPGVLLSNRKINVENADLRDIGPTIHASLGLKPQGRDLFAG